MTAARPAGDAALLVDADGVAARLASAIGARRLPGVLDVVPGARTVLVVTEPGRWDLADLAWQITALPLAAEPAHDAPPAEIPVSYDGPDLAEVAELTGLTGGEVVARHQAAEYRVGWLGFSPGFGYLTGLDPALAGVPRLDTPRLSVPAGSVAIAGGLAAVYPAALPGGWRLLGRTTARLWDPARDPPALLAPGMRVRFRAAEASDFHDPVEFRATGDQNSTGSWNGPVEVMRPGPLGTIQDLGRPGYGHLGVPRSGAADPGSLRLANRLVGNPAEAAGLEFTLGRAVLRIHADTVVAVTGAAASLTITAEGSAAGAASEAPLDTALAVPAGSVLRLGSPVAGVRSYLAIGGGIDIPPVLGSRSSDLLSGLGPRPLRPGDRLPVGPAASPPDREPSSPAQASTASPAPASVASSVPASVASPAPASPAPARPMPANWAPATLATAPHHSAVVRLRILAGPRDDWFDPAALRLLAIESYQVTPASNRTGLRLAGPALARARPGELPSEGMVTGAIQVPPDGQPIVLLADHPATGGYPVIAVVHSADLGAAAQLRPGQRVRFTLLPALWLNPDQHSGSDHPSETDSDANR